MKEINYEFRKRYSIVHRDDRLDFAKKCPDGYVEVSSDWCITLPNDAPVVIRNAARDLEDYFFVSMGVSVKIIRESEWNGTQSKIAYGIDPAIKEHSYRFAVAENEIVLCGTSDRMAAQAGYYIEDLMNLEEAPFLNKGEEERSHMFRTRMTHSGVGLDMFPDEHMISIAHAGMTALLIFVKGRNRFFNTT